MPADRTSGLAFKCSCVDSSGRHLNGRCPRKGERGHGRWYPRLSVTAADGSRRTIHLGGFATVSAARAAREAQAVKYRAGSYSPPATVTTGVWLMSGSTDAYGFGARRA